MKRGKASGRITCAILCQSVRKAALLRVTLRLARMPCVGVFSTREALLRATERGPVELIFAEDALLKTALTDFSKRIPPQTAIVLIGDVGDKQLAVESYVAGNIIDYLVKPIRIKHIRETRLRWCAR